MLRRETPLAWRRGFTLHRRRTGRDAYGDPTAVYDMERPDYTAGDGTPEGICWQSARSWQSGGTLSGGARAESDGERVRGVLQGVVFGDLEAVEFDRFVIDGVTYELRGLERWPGHRLLLLQRLS